MKKFSDWLWDILPWVWGLIWILIITVGSVGVLNALVLWFLRSIGVIA